MPRGEVVGQTGAVERSYEHLALPRKGTQCALLAREVLVAASEAGPAIQRLRFAWPSTFEGPPECCEGSDGVVHVHVRAPALDGSFSEKLSRSVPRIAQLPLFVVLIEQSQKLSQAPAVQPHIDGRRRVRARYQDPHRQTRGLGVSGGAQNWRVRPRSRDPRDGLPPRHASRRDDLLRRWRHRVPPARHEDVGAWRVPEPHDTGQSRAVGRDQSRALGRDGEAACGTSTDQKREQPFRAVPAAAADHGLRCCRRSPSSVRARTAHRQSCFASCTPLWRRARGCRRRPEVGRA